MVVNDPGSIIAYISLFVLLVLSFYFSLTETAFSALNRIRIKNMAEKGSTQAQLTLTLYDDFDRLLSTLLVGSTISNLTSATICTLLFVRSFGDFGATLSTIFITIVVVVFAEVTPKTLAKESPEKYALFCAPILKFFMILLKPVNIFFVWWKKVLIRIFKTNAKDKTITEDELISIVEEAKNNGIIDESDNKLIKNIIEFYDQKAEHILTPRMDMVAISKNTATEDIISLFLNTGFSRVPVYVDSIDNIIGTLHLRDFFRYVVRKDMPLEDIISPAIFVPTKTDIGDLFKMLQQERCHLAVIVDEYGGTDGIVTMEDILEELLGEIWDEGDKVIKIFTHLGENMHRVICSADTHDFFEYFNFPENNIDGLPPNISGWIVNMLGKVPEQGDTFTYENLDITVDKAERRRALECIVTVKE